MSSWLVGHMNDLLDSTGVHQGLTCMFHIGRYSQASAFSCLWSTTCILEFLTKFIQDGQAGEPKEYPLSFFYDVTSAFNENIHFRKRRNKTWWYRFGKMYLINIKAIDWVGGCW